MSRSAAGGWRHIGKQAWWQIAADYQLGRSRCRGHVEIDCRAVRPDRLVVFVRFQMSGCRSSCPAQQQRSVIVADDADRPVAERDGRGIAGVIVTALLPPPLTAWNAQPGYLSRIAITWRRPASWPTAACRRRCAAGGRAVVRHSKSPSGRRKRRAAEQVSDHFRTDKSSVLPPRTQSDVRGRPEIADPPCTGKHRSAVHAVLAEIVAGGAKSGRSSRRPGPQPSRDDTRRAGVTHHVRHAKHLRKVLCQSAAARPAEAAAPSRSLCTSNRASGLPETSLRECSPQITVLPIEHLVAASSRSSRNRPRTLWRVSDSPGANVCRWRPLSAVPGSSVRCELERRGQCQGNPSDDKSSPVSRPARRTRSIGRRAHPETVTAAAAPEPLPVLHTEPVIRTRPDLETVQTRTASWPASDAGRPSRRTACRWHCLFPFATVFGVG